MDVRKGGVLVLVLALVACSAGTQSLGQNDGKDGGPGPGATECVDDSCPKLSCDCNDRSAIRGAGFCEQDACATCSSLCANHGGLVDGSPDAGPSVDPNAKRIFATSATYTGALGGVEGADKKCQTVADGATLGGTWKAWISDATVDAIDRIKDVGPWYLLDGQKAFENKANLTSTPHTDIDRDERGGRIYDTAPTAWTGTEHGAAADDSCQGWTSKSGSDYGTGTFLSNWSTTGAFVPCDDTHHLVCIEQ